MPFEKVHPEKLSHSVVRQIELLILEGILRPGERLPAERELSDRLGVSRPSLRDAVSELQERGLLVSRAGSGIFVADVLGAAFSPALVRLFSEHEKAMFDVLSFRRDMESLAAERATRYGSDTDLALIATIFDKMERAHMKRDPTDEAALDAEFHLAIVEASHNIIMLHMMRSMYDLLREGVFFNRQIMFKQKTTRASLLDQHRKINAALQARDGAAARRAIETHLDFVEQALSDHRRAEENEKVARRRLAHERSR
ncbi:MAG: FCD domain-containing protein [Paracoccaceae bacterium]|nr:FCD domain-containing protein [Paracoccaceae bacterium]